MDSDCLIKIAKSGLKELVCSNFTVVISSIIKEETVVKGQKYPDSDIIEENIGKGAIHVKETHKRLKGEESLAHLYKDGGYVAVCSDDKKYLRKLRMINVPYITPAVLITILLEKGKITEDRAIKSLERLKPYISEDEYSVIRMFLDAWREQ